MCRIANPVSGWWRSGGDRAVARRVAGSLHPPRRAGRRGRDLRRADPGRGRLRDSAARLPQGAPRAVRQARHPAGRRRSAERRGPHREDVGLRLGGSRARHPGDRQGAGLGHADRRVHRQGVGDDLGSRAAHGSTFGGNPVCCAAALATLDIVEQSLPHIQQMGERMHGPRPQAAGEVRRHRRCARPRAHDRRRVREGPAATKEPYPEIIDRITERAFRKGLLLLGCGKSTFRLAPPLVLDEYDVDTGMGILEECSERGRLI